MSVCSIRFADQTKYVKHMAHFMLQYFRKIASKATIFRNWLSVECVPAIFFLDDFQR